MVCSCLGLFISRNLVFEIEKMKGPITGDTIDLNRIDKLLGEFRSEIHGGESKDDSSNFQCSARAKTGKEILRLCDLRVFALN